MSLAALAALGQAIQEANQSADSVVESCRLFLAKLENVPSEYRGNSAFELSQRVSELLCATAPRPSLFFRPEARYGGGEGSTDQSSTMPPASSAVLELLKSNPQGLTAKQIIQQLAGKFQTSSPKPRRILVITISAMKKKKQIHADERGVFRIGPSPKNGENRTIRSKVIEFFLNNGNQFAYTEEIAEKTDSLDGTLRHLFASSVGVYDQKKVGTKNMWRLAEPVYEIQKRIADNVRESLPSD